MISGLKLLPLDTTITARRAEYQHQQHQLKSLEPYGKFRLKKKEGIFLLNRYIFLTGKKMSLMHSFVWAACEASFQYGTARNCAVCFVFHSHKCVRNREQLSDVLSTLKALVYKQKQRDSSNLQQMP